MGALFDNNLGLTSQAFTFRASGTQKRNFKTHASGYHQDIDAIESNRFTTSERNITLEYPAPVP